MPRFLTLFFAIQIVEGATEPNGLPWALQRLKKTIIFNVFCACSSKTQENSMFFNTFGTWRTVRCQKCLRDSGSGGGPIGRTTFENIASRAGKTTGFEKN